MLIGCNTAEDFFTFVSKFDRFDDYEIFHDVKSESSTKLRGFVAERLITKEDSGFYISDDAGQQ